MGRMERYKRDAYHVGKHSRPTPRLPHVIIYLFIYFSIYLIYQWQFDFSRGSLACLRFLKLFRVCRPLLEYLFCK